MPKTLLKRCHKCDRPVVRIDKEYWKWAKRTITPTEREPDLGKPICPECPRPAAPEVLLPYSVWEFTETGIKHTLIDQRDVEVAGPMR